jgi:hypothetical protein
MAITNHGQLVQAIIDWSMHRTDLASFAPDCITLAEGYLNYGGDWDKGDKPLRCREMETIAILSPTDGVYTLPSDYLQFKRISDTPAHRRSLSYIEPVMVDVLYPTRAGGQAEHFNILGNNLYTYPISTQDLELVYYARIPQLTALEPENWLLTKAPSVYLSGSLMYAADMIKEDQDVERYATMLRSFVQGLNDTDDMSRFNRVGLNLRGIVA